MSELYCDRTPIETVRLSGRDVFVKRDDLYARPPAPPLAKLRGLRLILSQAVERGESLIGCFEASQSRIGHGLAAAVREFPSLSCVVAYPQSRNHGPSASVQAAHALGAALIPVPSNIVAICYRQASNQIAQRGGWIVPFGFDCPEAVQAVEAEAHTVPAELVQGGTVVVPCGSGITLAGLLRGLEGKPARIIGVSVGRSVKNIHRCLARHVGTLPATLDIRPAAHLYRQAPRIKAPFPCDSHYDLKAWEVVTQEISILPGPILFWNVGG